MSKSGSLTRIAIHGVPRSGTSWVGEIFNSSPHTIYRFQPLFSYAHKGLLGENASSADIDEFFDRLVCCNDAFTNQAEKRKSGEFPRFEKGPPTHIAYKEVRYINILPNLLRQDSEIRLVAVIRNPLSVINSWLRAPREFRKDLGWSELEEWRFAPKKNSGRPEEFNGYEKWKEATKLFLNLHHAYPGRVYLLKYSQLLSRPQEQTQDLFEFAHLEYQRQTKAFLETSSQTQNQSPYSVFRQNHRDSSWRDELNIEIAEEIIDDIKNTEFEEFTF